MMSASELTWLQTEFRNNRSRQALADAQSLQDLQNARAAESIASHLSGDDHKVIVSAMRAAATAGAGQVQMIRFPSAACTDLGRRINSAQPGWGSTLQGRPADIYRFWEKELVRRDSELLPKCWSSQKENLETLGCLWCGASDGEHGEPWAQPRRRDRRVVPFSTREQHRDGSIKSLGFVGLSSHDGLGTAHRCPTFALSAFIPR